jgi:pre-mRNA-splicing factor SYF1
MPSIDHSSTKKLDLYLISEADIPYEQDVLRHPYTLAPWMRYIEHKLESPIHERVFVFERACRDLGRSYKVWKMYLDLRVKYLDEINPAKYEDEFVKVNECFERALMMLSKVSNSFWNAVNY